MSFLFVASMGCHYFPQALSFLVYKVLITNLRVFLDPAKAEVFDKEN